MCKISLQKTQNADQGTDTCLQTFPCFSLFFLNCLSFWGPERNWRETIQMETCRESTQKHHVKVIYSTPLGQCSYVCGWISDLLNQGKHGHVFWSQCVFSGIVVWPECVSLAESMVARFWWPQTHAHGGWVNCTIREQVQWTCWPQPPFVWCWCISIALCRLVIVSVVFQWSTKGNTEQGAFIVEAVVFSWVWRSLIEKQMVSLWGLLCSPLSTRTINMIFTRRVTRTWTPLSHSPTLKQFSLAFLFWRGEIGICVLSVRLFLCPMDNRLLQLAKWQGRLRTYWTTSFHEFCLSDHDLLLRGAQQRCPSLAELNTKLVLGSKPKLANSSTQEFSLKCQCRN